MKKLSFIIMLYFLEAKLNNSCLDDCLDKGRALKEKRSKALIVFLQITACIVTFLIILFALPVTAGALPPPSDEEVEDYTKDGTLDERIKFAESLGDGDTDTALVQNFKLRTEKLLGYSTNSQVAIFNHCMPSSGNVKVPVFIVDFSDAPNTLGLTIDDIQQQVFGTSSTSMTSFYKNSSYNALNLSGDVMGVYRAQYPLSYYKSIQSTVEARQTLVKEVLSYFDQQGLDFTQYDSNSDQYLDSFYIIWNGPTDGWGSNWYTYKAKWWSYNDTFNVDGLNLYNYVMYSVSAQNGIANNVFEHETGHLLGLPDYYSYDRKHQYDSPPGGVGTFDMMDSNKGDHNIFSKYLLGWANPQSVTSGPTNITLSPVGANPDGLIIMPNWGSSAYSEYFIAEYLTKTGNYASVSDFSTPGIRIYHIDARTNSAGTDFLYNNSYTEHKLIRVMEADGLESIEKGSLFNNGDLYRTGQAFSPDTYPCSDGYGGVLTGITMTGFSTGGATASVQVDFSGTQSSPAILRTFPADGTATAEKISKMQVVFNNWVYKDTGFSNINLRCLSSGVSLSAAYALYNNTLTIIPANPLAADSQYLLTIPADAVRNAAGSRLGSAAEIHFSTAAGASAAWGGTKTLPDVASLLDTRALCPMTGGGALMTFSGRDSAGQSNSGFLKTDQNGDIIWTKVFPQFVDNIVNSGDMELLQDGGVLINSLGGTAVTLYNASFEQVWSKTGKGMVLPDGNIGVFSNTGFTKYTPAGTMLSQKTISTKWLYAIARTSDGYFFVGKDSTYSNVYEFIQLDASLNKVRSVTATISGLPRSSSNMLYFPKFQTDDCIRFFRRWDNNNISVVKLGWDGSIINETQLSNTYKDTTQVYSDVKADGTVYLTYSTDIKNYNSRVMTVEKILPDNAVEWRKDIVYSPGNIDCTGLISTGTTVILIADTYIPLRCFQTISISGPVSNCTVTFDSKGGSPVTAQSVEYGSMLTAPNAPVREGYDFDGWYRDEECITQWVFSSNTVTDNMTLYAKWNIKRFTITFNPMGGSPVDGQIVPYNEKIAEPAPPYRANYEFSAWYTDSSYSQQWDFASGVTSSMTLYAKWTGISCTVTFDPRGGSTVSPATAQYNTLISPPEEPVKEGCIFGGWYRESGCINKWRFESDKVTGNMTLYAKWNTISYNITVLSNSTSRGTVTGGGTYGWGAEVTLTATPKAGCRFVRWTEGVTEVSTDAEYTFTSLSNRSFTAEFAVIGTPAISSISCSAYNKVKLIWGAVDGAAGYELWRATSSAGTYIKIPADITETSYTDTVPQWGKTYYYKVKAYCVTSTGIKTYGKLSAYKYAKPAWVKPALTASSPNYHSIVLNWNDIPDADYCSVYRSTSAYGTYKMIAEKVYELTYTDEMTADMINRTYYYKVRPVNAEGGTQGLGPYSSYKYAKASWQKLNLTATTLTYHSVKLSWNPVADADYYYVWRSTYNGGYKQVLDSELNPKKIYAEGETVEYTDDGLIKGKTYYYKVQPIDEGMPAPVGTGLLSGYKYAKADWPKIKLTAATKNYYSTTLSWNAIAFADKYEIYRSTSYGSGYKVIDTLYGTAEGTIKYEDKDEELIINKTYYYKILPYEGMEKGFLSSYKYAAPSWPRIYLTAASNTYNSVMLTWNAIDGATYYKVFRGTSYYNINTCINQRVTGTSTITYPDSDGLTEGKRYYYRVQPFDDSGTLEAYGPRCRYKYATPAWPAISLSVSSAGYNSLRLTWNKVTGADGYLVYRSTSYRGPFNTPLYDVNNGDTFCTDSAGLTAGRRYYYRIRAYDITDAGTNYSPQSRYRYATPIPSTPTGLTAVKAPSTSINLTWNAVDGAAVYEVYRATSRYGTYTKIASTNETSAVSAGLAAGRTYYFKVRAYTLVNGVRVYGLYSIVSLKI